jgi:hypothetical protein
VPLRDSVSTRKIGMSIAVEPTTPTISPSRVRSTIWCFTEAGKAPSMMAAAKSITADAARMAKTRLPARSADAVRGVLRKEYRGVPAPPAKHPTPANAVGSGRQLHKRRSQSWRTISIRYRMGVDHRVGIFHAERLDLAFAQRDRSVDSARRRAAFKSCIRTIACSMDGSGLSSCYCPRALLRRELCFPRQNN